MESTPVLTLTLLCLIAASQARNIFQPEAENATEGECSCDRRFLKHYESRGCVADVLDICGCPTKFSCPPTNNSLQVCIYHGQEYEVGSRIIARDSCQVCRCQEGSPPRMACVTRECPELTPAMDGDNCHPVYAENKCCPLRYECLGNEIEDGLLASTSQTCRHGGRVYPFGAKIQAADDPCLVCTCDEGWGDGNRTCVELDCVMERHQHKMDEGCVPVYHEGRCCPIEFYCPTSANASLSELPVPEETNTTYDDRCFFAGQSYGRGEEIPVEDNNLCVVCRCAIPPYPTCVHRACPPSPAPHCVRTHTPGHCCPDYECMMGDGPTEEEECPTPMCEHTNCRVAVPPGEKCPTCVCGEMLSELEHNNLEQQVQRNFPQQQVATGMEEMEPPVQYLGGSDDSSEGGLQLMPLVMEQRSVRQLGNASYEDEESDKEINEDDEMDNGQGLPELDRENQQGKKNGTLIINEIWSIDHDIEVPEGCPTPMCEGNWCKILIPEGHNCPTCICKRFDVDNEP